MRSVWAAAFLLRRLRAEAGVVTLILVLVTVTAFLLASAPRLFNLVADDGLRSEVAAASPVGRNLELSREFVVPPFEDPLAVLDQLGASYLARLPDSVRDLVADRRLQATTPRLSIVDPPNYTTFVSLRHQEDVAEATAVVDGRMPEALGEPLPVVTYVFGSGEGEEPPDTPPRVEVAFSERTAAAIQVEVGDALTGSFDATDPLVPGEFQYPIVVQLEVVGIFAIEDPEADVWYADNRLNEISLRGSVDNPIAFATALIAPDAYADVAAAALPAHYDWRYFVDVEALDAGQLEALVPDLRRTATQFARRTGGNAGPERISFRSGLLGLLERYAAERAASEAVLSIAATGPITLAGGAFAMTAVLLMARRRANLLLARDRGASGRLILGAQLWEAVLLGGLGASIGYLAAVTLVPGRGSDLSAVLAAATGLGAVVVLVAATWPATRHRPARPGRDEPPSLRTSPRRLVLEATAVGLAVAGVGLLQQRGLQIGGGGGGNEIVRFDPFLAAVPVLTGAAAAIVATRLYPVPIRVLGWLAARRRDLVPVLGLRSVARRASFTTLPLLVLMLTAAFGSFASVLLASVDRGQLDASWIGVGADYRVEARDGGTLRGLDVSGIGGIEATASGIVEPSTVYQTRPNRQGTTRLVALDADAYEAVTAGSPADPRWPAAIELVEAMPSPELGAPEAPIPAIVSVQTAVGQDPLRTGTVFTMSIDGQDVTLQGVEVRSTFPGVPPGVPFVVTSFPAIEAALARPPVPNVLFARGTAAAAAELAERVDASLASGAIVSRHAWYAGLREAPLIAVVGDGFRAALLVAAAYALLAVVAALTLSASRRTRDVAFLRTLGLSARQSLGVTVVEHGTPVLVALVPGIATGIAVAALLETSLGLGAFIGPEVPFRIHVDWPGILLVGGSLIIVVAVAIAVSTWLARRAGPVEALRAGDA